MFLFRKKCNHERFSAAVKSGYCPDCGEYVENKWFVTRCPICGKRHKTVIKNNKPVPVDNFCTNCGTEQFIVEEIEFPDIVSINYAAYITKSVKQKETGNTKAWIENSGKIKFLTLSPV
jgi:hypothetical protein